jgi:hypothetical protein
MAQPGRPAGAESLREPVACALGGGEFWDWVMLTVGGMKHWGVRSYFTIKVQGILMQ